MIRKLLTKPIWWWERNRSYPIRSKFHLLTPIHVEKGAYRFVVLTTVDALLDSIWTAWSWYRYLQPRGFELSLAVDGKFQQPQEVTAQKLFPGISIFEIEPLLAPLCQQWPALDAFFHQYPLGRKLGLLIALSASHSFLYSDNDVLSFHEPTELLSYVEHDLPCFIEEEREGHHDPAIIERSNRVGLGNIARLNSGLLYIPRNSLAIDIAAQLLNDWRPPATSWFTEQAVISVLMRNANAQPLPPDRYVVSSCRQFYWQKDFDYHKIVARHFTGTVRHVMYNAGIPEVLRQARQSNGGRPPLLNLDQEGQV